MIELRERGEEEGERGEGDKDDNQVDYIYNFLKEASGPICKYIFSHFLLKRFLIFLYLLLFNPVSDLVCIF